MLANQAAQNEKRYKLLELASQGEGYQVFRATQLSISSPCFFHQIELPEDLTDHLRYLTTSVLKNYARVLHPRAPRISDAWFSDIHVVVVESKWEAPKLDIRSRNPLRNSTPATRRSLLERTIGHLSALHSNNIVHGFVAPDIFGMDDRGKVFLLDTGIDRAMHRLLAENQDSFSLATNLQARDLADLIYHLLSMMAGENFLNVTRDDQWDDIDFKEARNRIRQDFPSVKVQDFLLDCLTAYGMREPRFESATEAWNSWQTNKLGSEFR